MSEQYVALTLVAVAVSAAVAAVLALRRRDRPVAPPSRGADPPDVNPDGSGRFHALSIRAGRNACAAARAVHSQRFLAKEAPELPLPGCDRRQCYCRIVHHRDRRSGDDRRQPFQGGFGGSATRIGEDRRHTPDRRSGGGARSDQ